MNEFELFKSNVCQMIKNKDSQIVINEIRRNLIDEYFDDEEYDKALYLVAMIEYLCRRDSLKKIPEIDKYKGIKLSKLVYPAGVELVTRLLKNDDYKKKALNNAEPEFLKHNIVEGEIENVY